MKLKKWILGLVILGIAPLNGCKFSDGNADDFKIDCMVNDTCTHPLGLVCGTDDGQGNATATDIDIDVFNPLGVSIFPSEDGYLSKVRLAAYMESAPSGSDDSFEVKLYKDCDGSPCETEIGEADTTTLGSDSSQAVLEEINFSTEVFLEGGQKYWVVLRSQNTSTGNDVRVWHNNCLTSHKSRAKYDSSGWQTAGCASPRYTITMCR